NMSTSTSSGTTTAANPSSRSSSKRPRSEASAATAPSPERRERTADGSLPSLTLEEVRLRRFLRLLAAFFGGGILFYVIPALLGPLRPLFVNLPFVTNSAVKMGTLGMLAFVAAADVRRLRVLVTVLILAHVVSELAVTAVLLFGDAGAPVSWGAGTVPV